MAWEIWFTLAIVATVLVMLATTPAPTEVVLLGAMITLSIVGVISPIQALSGFSSPGVMTIAALYVVIAGLRETGAIAWLSHLVFGRPRSLQSAQAKLMGIGGLLSTVINNTPVVAMFIPIAQDWAARYGFPISRLLMPMNVVVILAGLCTLIGTSTNLAVYGLLQQTRPDVDIGLFDLIWIGLPLTLLGIAYALLFSRRLLPDRQSPITQLENAREYAFQVRIHNGGPLVGRTIAEVGLRNLKSAYVLEIERESRLLTSVGPDEVLCAGDQLTCVGIVDAIKDLRRLPGLSIAEEQGFTMNLRHTQRQLVEIVLSSTSPLINHTVRQSNFRELYGAAIISISREGSRIPGKVGDIEFRPGDTLLVEAGPSFVEKHKHSRDFLLVSALQDSAPPDFRRAPLSFAILLLMIVFATLNWAPLFEASFIAAGLMVATGCLTMQSATRSIEYHIVAGIAASFAMGVALEESGAAALIGRSLVDFAAGNPLLALAALCAVTMLVTELITNNAAGVLMFPIAMSMAELAGADFMPFVITVMVAASMGFVTPIGYQTNLMVYGPGGYRMMDFIRFGLPLKLLCGVVTILIVPRVWPF
ncbi:MAG: SLC13 family permease [Gammaproteobacteria bacterium]|nr:MAG: SLC13 family permease [Gammaproteobacteria bacterium]